MPVQPSDSFPRTLPTVFRCKSADRSRFDDDRWPAAALSYVRLVADWWTARHTNGCRLRRCNHSRACGNLARSISCRLLFSPIAFRCQTCVYRTNSRRPGALHPRMSRSAGPAMTALNSCAEKCRQRCGVGPPRWTGLEPNCDSEHRFRHHFRTDFYGLLCPLVFIQPAFTMGGRSGPLPRKGTLWGIFRSELSGTNQARQRSFLLRDFNQYRPKGLPKS